MPKKRASAPPESVDYTAHLTELRDELAAVKRLLMVLLVKLGADSNELGHAVGVSASRVRDMISLRRVRKLPLPKSDG